MTARNILKLSELRSETDLINPNSGYDLIFLNDFMIDANYMYLKEPPPIDHPLISGEWPYYLFNLEFIVLFFYI